MSKDPPETLSPQTRLAAAGRRPEGTGPAVNPFKAAEAMAKTYARRRASLASLLPASVRPRYAGDKAHKIGNLLGMSRDDFYRMVTSVCPDPDRMVQGSGASSETVPPLPSWRLDGLAQDMQYLDTLTYLPGDILAKVDRATMAVGLEARAPLLDHRVIAFAWSLPQAMKIRGGSLKWLLRQVAHIHVPRPLLERPKAGFSLPIGDWLRGPLRV